MSEFTPDQERQVRAWLEGLVAHATDYAEGIHARIRAIESLKPSRPFTADPLKPLAAWEHRPGDHWVGTGRYSANLSAFARVYGIQP